MSDYWGTNAALDGLLLAAVGTSVLLLTALVVVSISVLRPKGDRLPWSIVAVGTGLLVFGLAWYAVTGAH